MNPIPEKCCEKNCPDYSGMAALHAEQCTCSCHSSHTTQEEEWEKQLKPVVKNIGGYSFGEGVKDTIQAILDAYWEELKPAIRTTRQQAVRGRTGAVEEGGGEYEARDRREYLRLHYG